MSKLQKLIDWFDGKGTILVALSGGVDSALVAYAAHKYLGDYCVAVTADYKTLAQEELESAKKICSEIGIRQIIIEYNELENPDFVKNDMSRCFHCRTELVNHLTKVFEIEKANLIVDGTNLDDLKEYRPGIVALRDHGVKSPLVEVAFTKLDVRNCAREAGLSIYDKPSNSCLASRIPWGDRVTSEKLVRIEKSEMMVKQLFGIRQVRVRDFDDEARIEVDQNDINLLSDSKKISTLMDSLKEFGFKSVFIDPEGYRPGKLNVIAD
ncbi:MAG: ATP-dependent sacrificial sulfur transferase LarE [Nitrosotalea sp.]